MKNDHDVLVLRLGVLTILMWSRSPYLIFFTALAVLAAACMVFFA